MKIYKINNRLIQSGQKYGECQLVVALNAAYWLGEKFIFPKSEEYERLVDLTGARYGSAIDIEYAYKYLRLKYVDVKPIFESIEFAMVIGLPISLSVSVEKYGLHSVVILQTKHDNINGGYKVRVPNLNSYTDKNLWIHWERLKEFIIVERFLNPECGYFRIFYKNPILK
jgi:hypothetical protein